jgi:hypothetical protein
MTTSKLSSLPLLIGLISLLWYPSAAQAIQEELRNYRGVRSSGMGGVLFTTGDYAEALFGNPARHSAISEPRWTIFEVSAETNTHTLGSTHELSSLRSSSGAATISNASKLIGENQHLQTQAFMGYFDPHFIEDLGFAAGFVLDAQTNVTVNYTTDVDNQIIVDAGPAFGFSYPFLDKNLLVGLNLRLIYRAASDGVINSLDFLTGGKLSLQNFGKQGVGIDGDLGAYYHIPWNLPFARLSAGATLSNFIKSHYDELPVDLIAAARPRPANNDRLFNIGFRLDFEDKVLYTVPLTAPIVALEFQDIGDAQKRMSFAKRTHIGAETKIYRILAVRAGLNQGYLAGGIGLELPVVRFDFATYGEELAGNAGQVEDRRFLVRLAFEL